MQIASLTVENKFKNTYIVLSRDKIRDLEILRDYDFLFIKKNNADYIYAKELADTLNIQIINNINQLDKYHQIDKITYKNNYLIIKTEDSEIKISIDDYQELSLYRQKYLDDDNINRLKNKENKLNAYLTLTKVLSRKELSVKEAKDYLKDYDLDDNDQKNIINKLSELRLLDDKQYALNKSLRMINNHYSYNKICNELTKAGIDDKIIEANIFFDEQIELDNACKKANKCLLFSHNHSLAYIKNHIRDRLYNDGFKTDTIDLAIECLNFENEEAKEDEKIMLEYQKVLKKYQKKYSGFQLNQHILYSMINKGFKSEDIKKCINRTEKGNETG